MKKLILVLSNLIYTLQTTGQHLEFFYEEMSINSHNETNFSRTYIKYPFAKIERTANKLSVIYNLETGETTVFYNDKKEIKITTISQFLNELSDRINGFIKFGKTFVGEIKLIYTGEKTNIRGFNCVKLVDNFGGYYYITTDLISIKTNFDEKLLKAGGFEYNYDTYSRLFGLKELTVDEKSKYYLMNGYIVEQLGIVKTLFFTQSNYTYTTKVGYKVDNSIFEVKTNGYKIIKRR